IVHKLSLANVDGPRYDRRQGVVSVRTRMAAGLMSVLALSTSLSWGSAASAATVQRIAARDVQTYAVSHIALDGSTVFDVPSFVHDGTTYMPIWYVMKLLDTLGIGTDWNGSAWRLQTSGAIKLSHVTGSGDLSIYVNGKLAVRAPGLVRRPPGFARATTFAPIWYVMRVLQNIGVTTAWNGSVWTVTHALPSASPAPASSTAPVAAESRLTLDGRSVPSVPLQNSAANDVGYWRRASDDFYLSAQTDNPDVTDAAGTSLLFASVGQPLYLFAFQDGANVLASQTSWLANSTDATITPQSPDSVWTQGSDQIAKATFVAQKPGIYTIQAHTGSNYSIPLVITVGLPQLISQPFAAPAKSSGILPFAGGTAVASVQSGGGVTATPYAAAGGWIPVQGTVSSGRRSITVELTSVDDPAEEWDYRLPVGQRGQFSALLRSPMSGAVDVAFLPHFLSSLTASGGLFPKPALFYEVAVAAPAPSALRQALFASSQMDFNMSPRFAQVAATLLENSPSLKTAIEAISNYVSESIVYNQAELSRADYRWQDALTAWNTGSGICEDYASLAASLLKSIGLPVQLVSGTAQNGALPTGQPATDSAPSQDNHTWDQVWVGNSWMPFDPTWATDDTSVNAYITNEFFGNTVSLQQTHTVNATQTGISL
ncbi:MAG: transglutaminase-like domain-containing protein, partial [Firmicutes bacterium]|nr:transglutaminase-like domain-containing protein [Bacillota bacterium]